MYIMPECDNTKESIDKVYKYVVEGMCKYGAPTELLMWYAISKDSGNYEDFINFSIESINIINDIINKYYK